MMASAALTHRAAPVAGGLQNFSGDGDRKRLTGAAVKAVLRLVDAWGGSNAEGGAASVSNDKGGLWLSLVERFVRDGV